MNMTQIPFGTTDWARLEADEHAGAKGKAYWRTREFGEPHTELRDGRVFVLKPGMTYQVADDADAHRSFTPVGAKLFIVD